VGKLVLLAFAVIAATGCTSQEVRPRHELHIAHSGGAVQVHEEWVTPWTIAAHPFDEVLPSWNIDLPAESAFRVELCVAREDQESPWLDMGGWGAWPSGDRGMSEFPSGKVSVDLLKLSCSYDRARLRIRTLGLSTGEAVDVRRLTLCFSAKDGAAKFDPGPRPTKSSQIELAQRRQKDESPTIAGRICSPTAVAMVLEHHGHPLATAQVAATLFDAENDIYGNWNRAVQGAYLLGVPGQVIRVQTWKEAEAWIQGGRPLILSIGAKKGQLSGAPYDSTAGHLIVLCGFDGLGGAWIMDPAAPPGESAPRLYSVAELELVWLKRGGFGYLIAPEL
jgi:hypothetical protein